MSSASAIEGAPTSVAELQASTEGLGHEESATHPGAHTGLAAARRCQQVLEGSLRACCVRLLLVCRCAYARRWLDQMVG